MAEVVIRAADHKIMEWTSVDADGTWTRWAQCEGCGWTEHSVWRHSLTLIAESHQRSATEAQTAVRVFCNDEVVGSSPTGGSK